MVQVIPHKALLQALVLCVHNHSVPIEVGIDAAVAFFEVRRILHLVFEKPDAALSVLVGGMDELLCSTLWVAQNRGHIFLPKPGAVKEDALHGACGGGKLGGVVPQNHQAQLLEGKPAGEIGMAYRTTVPGNDQLPFLRRIGFIGGRHNLGNGVLCVAVTGQKPSAKVLPFYELDCVAHQLRHRIVKGFLTAPIGHLSAKGYIVPKVTARLQRPLDCRVVPLEGLVLPEHSLPHRPRQKMGEQQIDKIKAIVPPQGVVHIEQVDFEDLLQHVMEEEVFLAFAVEAGANGHPCAVEAPSRKAQEAHQVPGPDLHLVAGNDSAPLVFRSSLKVENTQPFNSVLMLPQAMGKHQQRRIVLAKGLQGNACNSLQVLVDMDCLRTGGRQVGNFWRIVCIVVGEGKVLRHRESHPPILFNESVKIRHEQTILNDTIFFKFRFSMDSCNLRTHFSCIL